jgi:hypothetical protein
MVTVTVAVTTKAVAMEAATGVAMARVAITRGWAVQ